MNPDFDSIAVANHPGVSPTGLRIAVNMLQGKKVDTAKLGGVNGLSFVLPLAAVITQRTWLMAWRCAKASRMPSCSTTS